MQFPIIFPVLRIRDIYPGSEFFFPFRIQGQNDSGSRIRIYIKEFKYTQNIVYKLSGILIFYLSRIQESKGTRIPDPQHYHISDGCRKVPNTLVSCNKLYELLSGFQDPEKWVGTWEGRRRELWSSRSLPTALSLK
jgi:hypothetical protein